MRPVEWVALIAGLVSLGVGYIGALDLSTFRLVAVAVAIVVLPIAAFHRDLLVVLFLGLLWARVSDVGITAQGLPSMAVPFALALLGLAIGRRLVAGQRISVNTFRGLFPVLPYVGLVVLSALWAVDPQRSLATATDLAKDVLIFWVLVELMANTATLKMCCLGLVLAAGALSALSVYQQVSETFSSPYGGFAEAPVRQIVDSVNFHRLAGPIGDPNFYALILLVTVPLGLALLRVPQSALGRAAVVSGVVLISGAVLLTYSRGGVLVLAGGWLASLAGLRRRAALLLPVTLALPAIVALAPGPVWERMGTVLRPFEETGHIGQIVDTSVELRLGAQRVALEMFLDHPFVGVGAGNYPLLYQQYSRDLGVTAVSSEFYPHNLYLQVAAETGTLGLLTFLPVALGPLFSLELARRRIRPIADEAREWSVLAFGIEVALACYLAASLMLHASYPRYFWLLLALVVAARRLAPASRAGI